MNVLDSVNFSSIMTILSNVVLGLAIVVLLANIVDLWLDLRDGEVVIPYTVPFVALLAIALATVLIFHFSPLHLLWLIIVCFIVSIPLMLLPPVQWASMGIMVLLAGGGLAGFSPPDEREREYVVLEELEEEDLKNLDRIISKKKKRQQKAIKSAKSSKKKSDKGFG